MHMRRVRLIGLMVLAVALLGLLVVPPRTWFGAQVAAWRYPAQVAVADQFLDAAARGDTAALADLGSSPGPVTQWLGLSRGVPAVATGLPARELAWAGADDEGPGGVGITYRLPTPLMDSLCSGFGRSDGLQLRVIPERDDWKVSWVGLGPC
jgi:hypothetical protein